MLKKFSILNLKMIKTQAIFLSSLSCLSSYAALSNTSTLNLVRHAQEVETSSKFKGSVNFQTNQWVEGVGEVVGNKYFGELDLEYKSNTLGGLDKKFELKTRVNDEEQLMFSIPESYVKHEFGNNEAYFGRKILNWNKIDSTWGFGKLNNRINFDGFEPGQEGLTGVNVIFRPSDSRFSYSVFGSVFYAPELNPGTKIDKNKGTISCQNAWCKAPDASADTNQDGTPNTPIFYNVNIPELSEVVFRYSAGANIAFETEDLKLSGFAIRKPENNISLSVEVSLDAGANQVLADVTPQVYYHNVYGMEARSKKFKNLELYTSYLRINPDRNPDGDEPLIVYTGIKPNKKIEEYIGTGASYSNNSYSIAMNYVARISEFDISDDVLVEYPRWNQAVNLAVKTRLTKRLGVSFDYKYDMLTEDRLTMLKANYLIKENMIVSAGANVIGSSSETDSFWSDFINNDTVYSSFKYLF